MAARDDRRPAARDIGGFSYRTIAGIAVAALIVLFIALNREKTEVSFVLFSEETALWIALTLAAVGGFIAGFLVGRRHHRA